MRARWIPGNLSAGFGHAADPSAMCLKLDEVENLPQHGRPLFAPVTMTKSP